MTLAIMLAAALSLAPLRRFFLPLPLACTTTDVSMWRAQSSAETISNISIRRLS
jgi:hypothetical protein